jgi:Fic family protein
MLFATPEPDEAELGVLKQIDDLKGALRLRLGGEPRRWAGSLRRLSFARAIQGSNSIEGYDAALDDAAAVAVGEDPLDAGTETRLALEGYRNAMTYVLQIANEPDFAYDLRLVQSLHFMMTSYHLGNRPGRWRSGDIFVRNDASGDIVYEGAPLEEVPALMAELVAHLNSDTDAPIIVRAGMAHLNLVMIHPFRDGNGRMARCLQSLVLARGGILTPTFMSIEEYLGRNTAAYYDALAEVGGGRWQPQRDARRWVRFTLTAHLRQAQTLLRRITESERLWVELERLVAQYALADRTMVALYDAALGLRVRNATYRAAFAENGEPDEEISEQTASRDFRQLVTSGLLVPHGASRGRYYTAGNELRALRRAIVDARDPRDESDPFAARPA